MIDEEKPLVTQQEAPPSLDIGAALGVGGPDVTKKVVKAKNAGASAKRLIKYLRPQIVPLLFMMLIAAIGAWFAIWVPDIMKKVTNHLVESIQYFKDVDLTYVAGILWTCVALYILNALFILASGLIAASMSQHVVRRMRDDVKSKLDKVPLSYFDQTPVGETLSRVTNDIEMVAITLQETINQVINSIMTVIGVYIMMARIDFMLSIIALVSLPVLAIVTNIIIKKSQSEFAYQQQYIGSLNGHIEEMYTGHRVIKLYGKEQDSIMTYEEINEELRKATRRSQFLAGIILPAIKFVNNVSYVLVCVLGAVRAVTYGITIGDIQAFIQYTRQFAQPIENVSNIANTIQSALAAAERVFEVLDLQELVPERDVATTEGVTGKVDIKDVYFSYDKSKQLITNFNLSVDAGKSIAIVGPTGAGKTTIVNLLMRFYELDSGSIAIDGYDIRDYSYDKLRSLYGMVLQETWLFNGTVAENIAYGNEGATREQIEDAAKKAYAHTFIIQMENGYDTVLNEDATNISQGQKQLLTIARAILKDPKIIILDEATSSVDTRTEKYIQSAMLAMMEGKTSFVIAHRLSTIKNAAIILVMNKGNVIEAGNHETLMAKKGFYADLYNSQFAGQADAQNPAFFQS